MVRRAEDTDRYTGGPIRITFGQHVICDRCKGMGVDVPMSEQEKRARKHAASKRQPIPLRWDCDKCGGTKVIAIDD